MIRVLLRESLLTLLGLVIATIVAFAALDTLGDRDWFNTARYAGELGVDRGRASTGDLPLLWNREVADARARTLADLAALGAPATREAAGVRLARRGSAALPTVFSRLPWLAPEARLAVLQMLARSAPTLTGGDAPPTPAAPGDDAAAVAWWDRFYAARLLDFRPGYASRQAERLAARDSRNAAERVARLGTYALPALVQALASTADPAGVARVANALADVTGMPWRLAPDATAAQRSHVVEGWKAFWFSRRLEFETLPPWQRTLGHFTETRYGHWLQRALRGRFGVSRVTGRPVSLELRERLPVSALAAGIGGLLAVAGVIAFGGGVAMRARPLRTKLLDLVGSLVPGLAAFAAGWVLLVRVLAFEGGATRLAASAFESWGWLRVLLSTAACGALASLWVRRPALRAVLHAVRVEAEEWVAESLTPTSLQVLRHGARLGVASLLAPLGLAAPVVLGASLFVELVFGLRGMGALTIRALTALDAPWLMMAMTSVIPLLLGRRWALGSLAWLLGVRARSKAPSAPPEAAPPTPQGEPAQP